MSDIRVGIIGVGNMGSSHAIQLDTGKVKSAIITAACDLREDRLDWVKNNLSGEVECFQDVDSFLNKAQIDAVIVATPHYDHPALAIKAFEKGLHVLVEKPAGVFTKNVQKMNEAAKTSGKVFSMMFNQRTNPIYQKLRDLIQAGELGKIKRTNWIITDWYRSQSYYDSGDWRATWKGEGGGVLINQSPHQLDLWQWIIGMMPTRVHGFCSFGKYRNIEVEDDVTAYVEYENGATGVFVTTIGEAPGTNRFEVVGDRGKFVIENNKLVFHRLIESEVEFNERYKGGFGEPETWKIDIPIQGKESGHLGILQNWIDAIVKGTPLIAPGEEGINGLELSNAMHLSTWLNKPVELPINADLYYEKLQEKIKNSSFEKTNVSNQTFDLEGTY